jgi:hypothetical protein
MSSAPPDFQLWQPPENWSDQPRPRTSTGIAIVVAIAGVLVLVLLLGVALVLAGTPKHRGVSLPRTAAEARAQEGSRIRVDAGTTPDHRSYTIEVSVSARGDYCDFITIDAPPGGGGSGGGGCGPGSPMSYSYGSDGVIHGITDGRIATIEVISSAGHTTVATKPLPSQFNGHRHFVAVLPAGIKPDELVGRDSRGRVVARQGAFGR